MKPMAHHVTLRLVQDQVIAPTPEARRIAARSVLMVCRGLPLIGFACVDTHLHLVLALMEMAAKEMGRRAAISLQRRLGLGSSFEPARARPVGTVWHLQNALKYLFQQGRRHDLPLESYLEASSLPDLLGMRPMGAYVQAVVRQHLPRLRRQEVLGWVGRPELVPATRPFSLLPEAARRAAALGSLVGHSKEAQEARRAVLALTQGELTAQGVASLLGVSRRSVFRLARATARPDLVRAVGHWLSWMAHADSEAADEGGAAFGW